MPKSASPIRLFVFSVCFSAALGNIVNSQRPNPFIYIFLSLRCPIFFFSLFHVCFYSLYIYHRAFTNHFCYYCLFLCQSVCSLLQLLYKVWSFPLTTQLNRWCLSNCHNQRAGPGEGGVDGRRRGSLPATQPGGHWRGLGVIY